MAILFTWCGSRLRREADGRGVGCIAGMQGTLAAMVEMFHHATGNDDRMINAQQLAQRSPDGGGELCPLVRGDDRRDA